MTNWTSFLLNPRTTAWSDCCLLLLLGRWQANLLLLLLDLGCSDVFVVRWGLIWSYLNRFDGVAALLFCFSWYCLSWFVIFSSKSFDNICELSYAVSAILKKIEVPRPPNFAGRYISFLSVFEQFIPPVIAGINSVVIMSSNRMRWLEMLVQNVGLYLNPAIEHE